MSQQVRTGQPAAENFRTIVAASLVRRRGTLVSWPYGIPAARVGSGCSKKDGYCTTTITWWTADEVKVAISEDANSRPSHARSESDIAVRDEEKKLLRSNADRDKLEVASRLHRKPFGVARRSPVHHQRDQPRGLGLDYEHDSDDAAINPATPAARFDAEGAIGINTAIISRSVETGYRVACQRTWRVGKKDGDGWRVVRAFSGKIQDMTTALARSSRKNRRGAGSSRDTEKPARRQAARCDSSSNSTAKRFMDDGMKLQVADRAGTSATVKVLRDGKTSRSK